METEKAFKKIIKLMDHRIKNSMGIILYEEYKENYAHKIEEYKKLIEEHKQNFTKEQEFIIDIRKHRIENNKHIIVDPL